MVECFTQVDQFFGTFGNLRHLTIKIEIGAIGMGAPLAVMVSSMQQLGFVTFQVLYQEMEDFVPTRLLEC